MDQIFAIIYGISAIALVASGLPQIIQVLKTKDVEGISLETYDMWLLFQILSMPYVLQSGNWLWVGANLLWAAYYAIMIVLIEHYRYPRYVQVMVDRFARLARLFPAPQHSKN